MEGVLRTAVVLVHTLMLMVHLYCDGHYPTYLYGVCKCATSCKLLYLVDLIQYMHVLPLGTTILYLTIDVPLSTLATILPAANNHVLAVWGQPAAAGVSGAVLAQ